MQTRVCASLLEGVAVLGDMEGLYAVAYRTQSWMPYRELHVRGGQPIKWWARTEALSSFKGVALSGGRARTQRNSIRSASQGMKGFNGCIVAQLGIR